MSGAGQSSEGSVSGESVEVAGVEQQPKRGACSGEFALASELSNAFWREPESASSFSGTDK